MLHDVTLLKTVPMVVETSSSFDFDFCSVEIEEIEPQLKPSHQSWSHITLKNTGDFIRFDWLSWRVLMTTWVQL